MKLRLLYFGVVREKLGRREETRDCPDGATVGELLAELSGTDGIFALGAGVIRIAVNREYVDETHVLAADDEVAVIPPVAGGVDVRPSLGSCAAKSRMRMPPPVGAARDVEQKRADWAGPAAKVGE